MASQMRLAMLFAACFAVLVVVCAAAGEGQIPELVKGKAMRAHVAGDAKQTVPNYKFMKPLTTEGKRPVLVSSSKQSEPVAPKYVKPHTHEGKRAIPVAEHKKYSLRPQGAAVAVGNSKLHLNWPYAAAAAENTNENMPYMPGMPGMTAPAPAPSSSSFTYPSMVIGFLAIIAAFFA